MSVTSVEKDFENLTLTVIAEFDAPLERVWRLWADPRLLERWWGPPTHPATVEAHDLTPDGHVRYVMTGPDGEASRGWWRITAVEPPRLLEFVDAWAGEDGTPNPDAPTTRVHVLLTEHPGGTRMHIRSVFESLEHMEWLDRIGAIETFRRTVGQMDALLAG